MTDFEKKRNNLFRNRFFLPTEDMQSQQARIRVLGIGGGGSNAVDRMVGERIQGVNFYVANTDAQALGRAEVKSKIQFGTQLTKGLGAGADPEKGRQAAMDDKEKFTEELAEADMVFVTAGMGGGTGTGAAPVISRALKETNPEILLVGVVTTPFLFEGQRRMDCAERGVRDLKNEVDSLIAIPNEKIFDEREMSLKMAYEKVNDVLFNAVQGISDLIVRTGYINVDFADVKTVMKEAGSAMMGTGSATGEERAKVATQRAIENPLLEDVDVENARGLLVNVTASSDITVPEFQQVHEIVSKIASNDATVIAGQIFDDEIGDEIRVTIVATGLKDNFEEVIDEFDELIAEEKPDEPMQDIFHINSDYSDQKPLESEDVIPAVFRKKRVPKFHNFSSTESDRSGICEEEETRIKA